MRGKSYFIIVLAILGLVFTGTSWAAAPANSCGSSVRLTAQDRTASGVIPAAACARLAERNPNVPAPAPVNPTVCAPFYDGSSLIDINCVSYSGTKITITGSGFENATALEVDNLLTCGCGAMFAFPRAGWYGWYEPQWQLPNAVVSSNEIVIDLASQGCLNFNGAIDTLWLTDYQWGMVGINGLKIPTVC